MIKNAIWKLLKPLIGIAMAGLSILLMVVTPNNMMGLGISIVAVVFTIILRPPLLKVLIVVQLIGLIIKALAIVKEGKRIQKIVDKKVKKTIEETVPQDPDTPVPTGRRGRRNEEERVTWEK